MSSFAPYPQRLIADRFVHPLDYGWNYTTLESAAAADNKGGTTTEFDIDATGQSIKYTYTGTGTDPEITALTFPVGMRVFPNGQNFNAVNKGFIGHITASGDDTFTLLKPGSVVGQDENGVTIGTGQLNLCSRIKAMSSSYELAAPLIQYQGQKFIFDDCEIITGTADAFIDIDVQSDIKWEGKVRIRGAGDSGNGNALMWLGNGSNRFDSEKCEIELLPEITGITTNVTPLLIGVGVGHKFNLTVKDHTLGITGAGSASYILSGCKNSFFKVHANTVDCSANGDMTILDQTGVENTHELNINAITNAGAGVGVGAAVSAIDNQFDGVIKNCDTDFSDGTGGNINVVALRT